jgi:hypothetical protein
MPCTSGAACYFLDSIGISHKQLFESWRRAQKEQAFGEKIDWAERARFLNPASWATMVGNVRTSVSEVQKAHRASQKLGASLMEAIGSLGETDDFASLAPTYTKIIKMARGDEGFDILCNPVRTESLRAVFPDDDEDAVLSLWKGSSEAVHSSVHSPSNRPPGYHVPSGASGLGIKHIEQATLSAAQAAFGSVLKARKRARRGSARFGDIGETLLWLRDSAMWVLGQMWKHVTSFAFVAAMIFAVVLTYCMFLGREYTSDLAVSGTGFVDVRTGRRVEFGDEAHTQAAREAAAATKERSATEGSIQRTKDLDALGDAVAGRTYDSGVCGVIFSGMDCIVRMILTTGGKSLASAVDGLFGARSGASEVARGHKDLAKWSAISTAESQNAITSHKAREMREAFGDEGRKRIFLMLQDGTEAGFLTKTVSAEEVKSESLMAFYKTKESSVVGIQSKYRLDAALQAQREHEQRKKAAAAESEAAHKVRVAEAEATRNMGAVQAQLKDAETRAAKAEKTVADAKEELEKEVAELQELAEKGKKQWAALQRTNAALKAELDHAKKGSILNPWNWSWGSKFGEGTPKGESQNTASTFAGISAEHQQYAAFALGSIILLSYLLGPVVAGALVVAIGAGAFAKGMLDPPAGATGAASTFQAVMIATTVFAGLITLMPVSSDEAHVMSSLAGMVMHTTTQVSDYRAQTAKAQADAMRVQDAASTAMYASVAGGVTGAAALAFTHDAESAARLAGAVHGGVAETSQSLSEARAAMHVYDATRFGLYV